MDKKILIYVSGGVVQGVCSSLLAEVEVIDEDSLRLGDEWSDPPTPPMSRTEIDKLWLEKIKGLKPLY